MAAARQRCFAGRITLWRDYFDVYDMFKGLLRGLVALVVPSLKATL